MNLDDFHRMVSFEVRRGNALDGMIPAYVKQSVNFLERNWPLKYMESWVVIELEPGDQFVDMIWPVRSWKFLRRNEGGEWFYLQKRDPREEQTSEGPVLPETYTQIGMTQLKFDSIWRGTEALPMEGMFYRFSDWQSTRPEFRHFLLDQASDLLLYQTMIRISASIKDPRLAQQYQPMRDEALKAYFSMDSDAQYEGSDDAMVYGGIYS